jgi:hypothetical protein
VHKLAPEITKRQAQGIITARDLAKSLNDDAVPKANGARWSYAVVYRMLKRGLKFGLPFQCRTTSEGNSRRRAVRRSQGVIASERRTAMIRLLERLQELEESDPVITAQVQPDTPLDAGNY